MMLASIWSFLGWKEENEEKEEKKELTPPPVTITGVRIPVDGTPAHLISLTTTVSNCYLSHVPDLRQFWKTELAWSRRDNQRIELVQQRQSSCDGIYYAFFSYAAHDLPENSSVPVWISSHRRIIWCGDVFLVKMAPHEFGEHAWAAYEDIGPEFMDLLANGPSGCW